VSPTENASGPGVIVRQYDATELASDISVTLPDLRSMLGGEGVHFLVGLLGAEIVRALDQKDARRASSIVTFLDTVLTKPNVSSEIRNAIAISFPTRTEIARHPGGQELLAQGRQIWAE
jgi:predicted AAA+ superfamily ATPase